MNTKKWKTTWDLQTLYKSINDPTIEKDVQEVEQAIAQFVKKYTKNKAYLSNPKALLTLFKDDEVIDTLPGSNKPLRYLHLLEDSGQRSPKADKLVKQIAERFKKASNTTLPIFLAIGKVDKATQKKFLVAKELVEYRYHLTQIFDNAKHQLSESEEKILSLKSGPASYMWVDGVSKALAKKTVRHEGKDISLGEATYVLKELPTAKRRKLYADIVEQTTSLADYAEGELNAFITNKKINDELRGFKEPYETSFKGHETRAQDILPFTQLVTENFSIAHKFYAIKKRLTEEETFQYVDRLATIGKIKQTFPFEASATLLHEAFSEIHPRFAEILDTYLTHGQIDVYPRKGKRSGAYQWGGHTVPNVVLLNHVNTLDSLTTFAHEMGHAIHSEFTQATQPLQYRGYSTAVAETASTFFENFVFEKVFETLSEKEQIVALHDKIDGSIATIFRQIAAFNFELELHTTIRNEGYATHEEIASMMQKHLKKYLGKSVEVTQEDGYTYIGWSHFRTPFYVYTYAYGELISASLYEQYKNNPEFLEKIIEIFKAGSSMPPHEIFKKIGIDTTKTDFFELGLKKIKADISRLDALTK